MKQSPLFSLGLNDFAKGLIMAVGASVFAIIDTSIQAGNFNLNWTTIWHYAMAATVVYIGKQFFTPAQPTQIVTTNAQGTVTQTAITTDSVDVNVNQIKSPGK